MFALSTDGIDGILNGRRRPNGWKEGREKRRGGEKKSRTPDPEEEWTSTPSAF